MKNRKNKIIKNVLVVGLGLIGSSLCRALKKSSHYDKIYGHDSDDCTIEYAIKNNFIDDYKKDLKEGIKLSDLIIFCVPVHQINKILEVAKNFFNTEKIFTDTLSSKKILLEFLKYENLLETKNFIFSHPMAGKENFGIKYSDTDLFQNTFTFISKLDNSDIYNIDAVKKMWKFAQSNTIDLDVYNHDKLLSIISHVPHVISFALSNVTSQQNLIKSFSSTCARGSLYDMTRIANSDPQAWASIFSDNQENIVNYLEKFIIELNKLKSLLILNNQEDLVSYLKKS